MSVRVDSRSYAYLKALALNNDKTITAEVEWIIGNIERGSPLEFGITRRLSDDGSSFSAHLGVYEIYEGLSLEEAKKAIADFRVKEGFDARRFKLSREIVEEDFRDPPLWSATEGSNQECKEQRK